MVKVCYFRQLYKFYFLLIVSDDCLILFKQLEPDGDINYFYEL